jgi:hypothetical protein
LSHVCKTVNDLIIREIDLTDADTMVELHSDPEVLSKQSRALNVARNIVQKIFVYLRTQHTA